MNAQKTFRFSCLNFTDTLVTSQQGCWSVAVSMYENGQCEVGITMSHYIPAQGAGVVGPSVTTCHSVKFSHATDCSNPLR